MRVAVITSKATSLANVARDVATVVRRLGHAAVVLDYLVNPYDARRLCEAAVVVMTFNPMVSRSWLLLSRDLNRIGVPSLVYATTEGRLPRRHVMDWMRRDVYFVANSRYTKSKLEEAGVQVLDVVYHGVDFSEVELALKYKAAMRRHVEERAGGGVVFGVVATAHPRKGHELFSEVVRRVREKRRDAKFYVVSTPAARAAYAGAEGVYVDTNFGRRPRTEALSLMAAFDFHVHPGLAEGFGLPVLEAMALGVPSIHLAYEPLTEFSEPEANIWVPYREVRHDSFGEGIEYELHLYDPKDFADAILDAVDMVRSRRSEYEDRRARAVEAARRFDAARLYPRLLELLERVERLIS